MEKPPSTPQGEAFLSRPQREDGKTPGAPGTTGLPTSIPSPSLPKGGGAIRGIGETFGTNPATGTSTFSVPIAASDGRNGFGPDLTLSYDSGSGNGPFGLGWSLGLPSVTRATDQGLPRYRDGEESDEFILSGAETLVPVLNQAGQRFTRSVTLHGIDYEVREYQPRTEGLFARIERWANPLTGISFWRSITRDNVTTLFGLDSESRIFDPADERRTFSWLICRTFDDKGNLSVYRYEPEDDTGVDLTQAHEVNRDRAAVPAQRYLKRVQYAAATPWFPNWEPGGGQTPLPNDWHFELAFDFGDHQLDVPLPGPDLPWTVRPDPFSSFRSGFEVRTYRRCRRVLMFHHFPGEPGVGDDCLVRSTDFNYSSDAGPEDPRNPIYTFIRSVTQAGYRRNGGGYLRKTMPPLEFEYSQPAIQLEVQTLEPGSLENLPSGLDGGQFQLVDLEGDGLSGILARHNGGWGYKPNHSPLTRTPLPGGGTEAHAEFGAMAPVAVLPSLGALPANGQFLDLEGDGRPDFVLWERPLAGFHERASDGSWSAFRSISHVPAIDWENPNLKFVDLSGDGRADLLLTEDEVFTVYQSRGEAGFAEADRIRLPWDERLGPRIVFADGTQTIHLADMSGDGLSDIVRVRNGEVCYWPNLGYGAFGRRITMDRSPRFVDEDRYDPARVRMADIDGTGTSDLIYIGENGVWICFNQSGNALAPPYRLAVFPTADEQSPVQVADLLGNGTACLVWSSPYPDSLRAPLRYVDLMGGQKPHLMIASRNNLGAETRVRYAPSTRFSLEDREKGRPWITRLPFPVHVVERVETYDWIGRTRFVSRYAYHHGYFDGHEREFNGFGMVEQWDTEELRDDTAFPGEEIVNWDAASWSPPVLTRTWFHTGAFVEAAEVSRQFAGEYWVEPALRASDKTAEREAMVLPDTHLPPGLSIEEMREAHRALKGTVLRTETYALDGTPEAEHPYSVAENSMSVRLIQPRAVNEHAVFLALPRERIQFDYERSQNDPRVTHELTLEVDQYANVVRSVTAGYPRRPRLASPEPNLSQAFQDMLAHDQGRLHLTASENRYTNAIDDPAVFPHDHRTPLLAESITAELTGMAPTSATAGITNLFRFDELDAAWGTIWDGNHDIAYEEVLAADVDGVGAPTANPARRIVSHSRTRYRRDDLTALLPLFSLQPKAITGEQWQLAFTPGLIARMFGNRVTNATFTEGGYVRLAGDPNWWIPAGRVHFSPVDADTAAQELAAARAHFYMTRRVVDPFGAISRVAYAHDLFPVETVDAVGNTVSAAIDYRVLMPYQVTDPNGNRVEAAFDALGMVVANAVMGKSSENLGDELTGLVADLDEAATLALLADPLADPAPAIGNATSRQIHDLFAYHRTRLQPQSAPPVVYSIGRERHTNGGDPLEPVRFQHAFAYSDGFGREIQKKSQAEPGPVPGGGASVSPRWVGSGWTIYNNKGREVRTYEPFFSASHGFEFARMAGVSTVHFHDPAGRVVAALMPNATWTKVVFDSWRQETWDANDTVSVADPRTDLDVGPYFQRFLGASAFVSWRAARIGGAFGASPEERAAEADAATKATNHAGTAAVAHLDALGRTCLAIAVDTGNRRYPSRTVLDAEDKPLAVIDPLGRRVLEHVMREPLQAGGFRYVAGYDLMGSPLYRNGMDDGERRTLTNVLGGPIRAWDSLGHAFRWRYDALQRPTHAYVSTAGAGEVLLERSIYGEALVNRNLRGRLWRQYDGAGLASSERYDFKGNLVETARHLGAPYRDAVDWSALDGLSDAAALDAAAAPFLVAGDRFVSTTTYDALNRPIQVVTPHNAGMRPSVIRPGYNEASLPDRLDVWVRQQAVPAGLLDPVSTGEHIVTDITYNARGQRETVRYGNASSTTYAYDPLTFRLSHMRTVRPNTFAGNRRVVQDLFYTYDPSSNITRIRDDADTQNVIYFQNQRIDPVADYTYDAVYRLVRATGREHLGQTGGVLHAPQRVNNDDTPRTRLPHPGDGNAVATYSETYTYDDAANLLTMVHQVSSGSWTRQYTYGEASLIEPARFGNRLSTTGEAGQPADTPYVYNAHGAMLRMPHLPAMTWDERDRLRSTTRQVVNAGTPETTWYTYDASGQRVRKGTDKAAAQGAQAVRRMERIYLGPLEIHREYNGNGSTVTMERETLHLTLGSDRTALIETRTIGHDAGADQLIRYQFSNHLGSAMLELDGASEIITYEEYFPFGSSAYQAVRSQTETPKRYRYTGKERDEENDLFYHGARYYAPWLGRWTSCDPAGTVDGLNLYAYARNNPVRLFDPGGTASEPSDEKWDKSRKNDTGRKGRERARSLRTAAKEGKTPDPMLKREAAARAATGRSPVQQHHHADIENAKKLPGADPKAVGSTQRMSSLWSTQDPVIKGGIGDAPVWSQDFKGDTLTPHNVADRIDTAAQGKGALTPQTHLEAADYGKQRLPATVDMAERAKMDWTATTPKGPAVNPDTGEVTKPEAKVGKAEASMAKAEAKAVKVEAKAVKAGGEALEKGGMAVLKKLGNKALKVVPFVGIGASLYSADAEASQGNKGTAALELVGTVPVAGDLVDAARLGVAVGEAANELLGIEEVAAEHGTAVESAAKSLGLSTDTARIVGATGAAISSITIAPSIAIQRTISGWFK